MRRVRLYDGEAETLQHNFNKLIPMSFSGGEIVVGQCRINKEVRIALLLISEVSVDLVCQLLYVLFQACDCYGLQLTGLSTYCGP